MAHLRIVSEFLNHPVIMQIADQLVLDTAYQGWITWGQDDGQLIRDEAVSAMVVGSLVRLAGVIEDITGECANVAIVDGCSADWIDRVTGLPGFGQTLVQTRSARIVSDGTGMEFPVFHLLLAGKDE